MTKKRRSNQAVSEVVDIVLLLGITIALFAFLNYIVFAFSFNESSPSVSLIGSIDYENNMINIEHNGGESLEGNTDVIIMIESDLYQDVYHNNSGELLNDTNFDTKWNVGEIVQFDYSELYLPEGIIDTLFIQVLVVDPSTNSLILSAVLQQGN